MSGNVDEWCWDSNSERPSAGGDDPTGPDKFTEAKVLKGGSWYEDNTFAKCAYRNEQALGTGLKLYGLRIVCRP